MGKILVSREALSFLIPFGLTDDVMAQILAAKSSTVANIRRNELGMIRPQYDRGESPCEVCGEAAQIAPDHRTGSHGWICQPCLLATRSCNAMHRWLLDHKGLGRAMMKSRKVLDRLFEVRNVMRLRRNELESFWRWQETSWKWSQVELPPWLSRFPRPRSHMKILMAHNRAIGRLSNLIRDFREYVNDQRGTLALYREAQFGGGLVEDKPFMEMLLDDEALEREFEKRFGWEGA